jgi:primosomal protein N' (replication factor Y)
VAYTPRTRRLAGDLKDQGLLALVPRTGVTPDAIPVRVPVKRSAPPALHGQQEEALAPVLAALKEGAFKPFLLQGVTGSGKTEVYLRAIAECVKSGQQALVLVPEIALTPLMVERFTGRFGAEVAVLHSRMTPTERTAQWTRVSSGQAKVALGARSALFAPARDLGLIVVDEEHESTYKQEDVPRYHARDAAVKRAQLCRCPVVLGTATPSLESYHNARTGKYTHLVMPDRVNRRPHPRVRMVDLKEEWDARQGERPVLTLALQEALRETLARKEQALLFLNRRGFTSMTLCLKCGEPVQCPHCSVAVTFHQRLGVRHEPGLLCHYCNWHGGAAPPCAKCGSAEVRQVGLGTQKVEEEVKALFPGARVGRLDLDATRKAGSLERVLRRFGEGDLDLLVGTQMIAKGHDFPGVTLVGIVGADTGLSLPDFRASERVFQLMVQVSGRAGRAEKEGIIYLQTFRPEHECLSAAVSQDVTKFLESELPIRKALGYPPFSRLCLIHHRGDQEKKTHEASEKAGEWLRRNAPAYGVEVRGPAPAPLYRLRGQFRFQILLKCAQPGPLRRLVAALETRIEVPQGVHRSIDMDPQSML